MPDLRILPPEVFLAAGATVQFAAVLATGAPASVTWWLEEPTAGSLTADGLFSHNYCASSPTHVRAQLGSDSLRAATALLVFQYGEAAFASVSSITRVSDGRPSSLDSTTGIVEVRTTIGARPFPCRAATSLRLELASTAGTIPLDSLSFTPALTALSQQTFQWRTTLVPNAMYFLRLVARRLDGSIDANYSTPIQVRNP
jgi:hypothetical protein